MPFSHLYGTMTISLASLTRVFTNFGARAQGTQVREVESGFRYTPNSTFETFPFPWPPGMEPKDDLKVKAVAAVSKELVERRDAWLNPSRATAEELQRRTLTALYNERP